MVTVKYDPKTLLLKLDKASKHNPFFCMLTKPARYNLMQALVEDMIELGYCKPWEESEY